MSDGGGSPSAAVGSSRKRSSRACDGCKTRRMKCEDVMPSPTSGAPTCKLCREAHQECTFEAPVRKRGPAPGFRRRGAEDSPMPGRKDGDRGGSDGEGGNKDRMETIAHVAVARPANTNSHAVAPRPQPLRRRRIPLFGLPRPLVDELLAVYFCHVHNVWPMIYKPTFNPHATSAPLLLAMLSIAACVSPPAAKDGFTSDKLFNMAETALHHCRNEMRIDILQALMILSLRQTGCGDKGSAFTYGGRASCMVLNLGLNLTPTTPMELAEKEIRARVYWNAYILDKILAEETGRCYILPYRRSSMPMPSVDEADEFETWPPQTNSSVPLPRSVRHVPLRRGYVMSYFVWTCRLGMIVEDILDLDVIGPPGLAGDAWDEMNARRLAPLRDPWRRAEGIIEMLEKWRAEMPKQLEVDTSPNVSPLPHHVIGLAWYHAAKILLYSRFIKRHPAVMTESADRAHRICSEASEAAVDLLAHLDRYKLLNSCSSDTIHLLSIITLFEAFDATDEDQELAHRAKVNFAQCCIWLRDFCSQWPAASQHKLFFEGLIQGGLKLTSGDLLVPGNSPETASSPSVSSPSGRAATIPEGLRAMGRNLASSSAPSTSSLRTQALTGFQFPGAATSPAGNQPIASSTVGGAGPSLFQLPQFYWNHITPAVVPGTAANGDAAVLDGLGWEWESDVTGAGTTPEDSRNKTSHAGDDPMAYPGSEGASSAAQQNLTNNAGGAPFPFPLSQTPGWIGDAAMAPPPAPGGDEAAADDPQAIYAALMSYMVQATTARS